MVITIIIWVDDLLIAAPSEGLIVEVKSMLSSTFKMKDLGLLKFFLGIEFLFSHDSVKMLQNRYIESVLARFNMSNCTTKDVPCDLSSSNNNNK